MRILLFSTSSGSRGGGEFYLLRLARCLVDLGQEPVVLMSDHQRMDELASQFPASVGVERVRYCNMYDRRLRTLGAIASVPFTRQLVGKIVSMRPDIVHVNQQVAEDGLELLIALQRAKLPLVSTIHVTRSPSELKARGAKLREWSTQQVLQRVSCGHIAVAHSALDALRSWCPEAADRCTVVHNGAIDCTTPLGASFRQQLRAEWGFDADHCVFGAVGRLNPQKDPLFLVSVAERVLAAAPQSRFVWIGDGELRASMEQAIERSGVQDRFKLLGWRSDIEPCLTAFDAFVMPSKFEGLPLALIEASGAGLPCIANAVDGIPEVIEDQGSGFLCRPGDLDGWQSALLRLANTPELRTRMGDQAQQVARNRFSVQAMGGATLAVYRRVVGVP